jgi:hypothetical protein
MTGNSLIVVLAGSIWVKKGGTLQLRDGWARIRIVIFAIPYGLILRAALRIAARIQSGLVMPEFLIAV